MNVHVALTAGTLLQAGDSDMIGSLTAAMAACKAGLAASDQQTTAGPIPTLTQTLTLTPRP